MSDDLKIKIKDLLDVGTRKALGYLPFKYLEDNEVNLYTLLSWIYEFGLTPYVTPTDHQIYSGGLYVYHKYMLQDLIHSNENLKIIMDFENYYYNNLFEFRENVHPHLYFVERFVELVAKVTVMEEKFPKMYRLIGQAFADERFI